MLTPRSPPIASSRIALVDRDNPHKEVRFAADSLRIKANKPFRSIRLDFRASSVVLPELGWERPYFVWLDYDDPLNMDILLDMQTVAARAKSGTALAVTVQCHRAPDAAAADEDRSGPSALDRFRDRFGRDRVPEGISAEDLYGWPFAELRARPQIIESRYCPRLARCRRVLRLSVDRATG